MNSVKVYNRAAELVRSGGVSSIEQKTSIQCQLLT